jgi:hypothetical protein
VTAIAAVLPCQRDFMYEPLLSRTHQLARSFLDTLDDPSVRPGAAFADLTAALGGPLPDRSQDATTVIEQFAADLGFELAHQCR